MKLAFILYKYFPYGGLQRDFLRIAMASVARGHEVVVYCMSWQGECPDALDVRIISAKGWSNHGRGVNFQKLLKTELQKDPVDKVVGFNKMAGLDVYYAADGCYQHKALTLRSPLYRLGTRYRHYYQVEQAVFDVSSKTEILMISDMQKGFFKQHYQTPESRFHLLPPGIARDRCAPDNAAQLREDKRRELNVGEDESLVLMVGSGFKTKGVDRAIAALAGLPEKQKSCSRLMVIGQDNPSSFVRIAEKLGVADRVHFTGGRDDVSECLLAADLLIHPAYNENTGTVLLEALVAGLPVLVTDVCGYAHYITDADAGRVIASPFSQQQCTKLLSEMLDKQLCAKWQANALSFSQQADLYSMPERAAELIEVL